MHGSGSLLDGPCVAPTHHDDASLPPYCQKYAGLCSATQGNKKLTIFQHALAPSLIVGRLVVQHKLKGSEADSGSKCKISREFPPESLPGFTYNDEKLSQSG